MKAQKASEKLEEFKKKYIGKKAQVRFKNLTFTVIVLEVSFKYGTFRFLVKPDSGEGVQEFFISSLILK